MRGTAPWKPATNRPHSSRTGLNFFGNHPVHGSAARLADTPVVIPAWIIHPFEIMGYPGNVYEHQVVCAGWLRYIRRDSIHGLGWLTSQFLAASPGP